MSLHISIFKAMAAIVGLTTAAAVQAQSTGQLPTAGSLLSGDTKLACEAILCLSTGSRPSECTPPIRRYFSINHRKPWETFTARLNFLNLCPIQNAQGMPGLVNAIAGGAGYCDAEALNRNNMRLDSGDAGIGWYISNRMPAACETYLNHPWTRLKETTPRYVGTPATGGQWYAPADYEKALARYKARMEAEKRRREENRRFNDGA